MSRRQSLVVVDSGVWIDFFNARDTVECAALQTMLARPESGLLLPDLVMFEVLRGFRTERELRFARQLFEALPIESIGGAALATSAAQRWRYLCAHGWSVRSAVDALLANYCIEHDHLLLHRDRDFEAYVAHFGLRTWLQPTAMN